MVESMTIGENKPRPILRNDGKTYKGPGWLGTVKSKSGEDMTEYSIGVNIGGKEIEIPTFVPGLTPEEIAFLQTEPNWKDIMNSTIIDKAVQHALQLIKAGKSPFKEGQYSPGMTQMVIED